MVKMNLILKNTYLFAVLAFLFLNQAFAGFVFETEVPLVDGSVYHFGIHENSYLGEISFRLRGTQTFTTVRQGALSSIPVLAKNVPETPIPGISLGIAHPTKPAYLWIKINNEWHYLRYGMPIPLPEEAVPTHILMNRPLTAPEPPVVEVEPFFKRMYKVALERTNPLHLATVGSAVALSSERWKMAALLTTVYSAFIAAYTYNQTPPENVVVDYDPFHSTVFVAESVQYFLYNVRFFDAKKNHTAVIRLYDNKTVIIDRLGRGGDQMPWMLTPEGILMVAGGGGRRISLPHFDMEAEFNPSFTEPYFDTMNPSVQKDPVEEVKSFFRDARELAKTSETIVTPEDRALVNEIKKTILNPQRKAIVILGASGTGKTTLALNLFDELPPTWLGLKVDASSLGSNTSYVGVFETRVKAMLLASRQVPIIWFIDEMHALQGTGRHMHQNNDFYETIKGALSSGEMAIVGTDTPEEYYDAFAANTALLNRFNVMKREPPTQDQLLDDIHNWVRFHKYPALSSEVLGRISELAALLDSTQSEPKRTISLIERTYAILLQNSADRVLPSPTMEDVDRAAKELYRVDASYLDPTLAREKIETLVPHLDGRIIGLDYAKQALLSLTKRSIAGVHNGQGPRVSALLFGPPGSGKTELAYAYADALNLPITRIEMNRINGFHVSSEDLVAEIAAALRKNSFSVILLDEIEKAPHTVMDSLLAVFDKGHFNSREKTGLPNSDKRSITVSARNATFILTSNAGSDWIQRRIQRKGSFKRGPTITELPDLKRALIKDGISPPFLDRVQVLLPITSSDREHFRRIIQFHIEKQLQKMSKDKAIPMHLVDQETFLTELTGAFYNSQSSNRDVLRMVIKYIDEALSNALLDPALPVAQEISLNCAKHPDSVDFYCNYALLQ